MNSKTKRANNQVNSVINVQDQRKLVEKANRILSEMKSFTWRELEMIIPGFFGSSAYFGIKYGF